MLFLQHVPDMVGGHNIWLAAFEGTGDTKQTYDIGIIGVEELTGYV
jgi:hypothetical protein